MRSLRSLKLPLILAAVALAAVALILTTTAGSPTMTTPPVTQAAHTDDGPDHAGDPAHTKPTYVRTLSLYTDAEPAPSAHPERMRARLMKGDAPQGVINATVLTDEDCAADNQGVSHCRNELRLPNGRTLTVRHPHRMHDVPCMTPGETVRVGLAVDA